VVRAIWNGLVLAESDDTVIVEGNQYFPVESLNSEHFVPSGHRSRCFWKGVAFYYDVVVDGERNANAAWYCPRAECRRAEDHGARRLLARCAGGVRPSRCTASIAS